VRLVVVPEVARVSVELVASSSWFIPRFQDQERHQLLPVLMDRWVLVPQVEQITTVTPVYLVQTGQPQALQAQEF
jgi:hypothetical protein